MIGKELVKDNYIGIHFTEDEERNFKKYMRLAQNMGLDTDSPEFDEKVAEAMEISTNEVENLRKMINTKPTSGSYVNEDGDECDLIDQIESDNYADTGIIEYEEAKEFLELLELTFDQLQERQKPMLSMLITSKITLLVNEDERLSELIKSKSFYDEEVFFESLQRREQIQAKEIAEKFGVVEASVSRTWKIFREKVRTENRRN